MHHLQSRDSTPSLPFIGIEAYNQKEWLFGGFLCKLTSNITLVCLFCSVSFLCALSFDRYLAVCCPIRARKLRNRKEMTQKQLLV